MIGYNTNILALRVSSRLSRTSESLKGSYQSLANGSRLNRPSDDAAGLAVAMQLNTNSRVYSRAILNVNDGVSLINIASDSLGEMNSTLIRMKELAVQAANGSLSLNQRLSLNTEATQLVQEFNRITQSTKFNSLDLLKGNIGELNLQLGFGPNGKLGFILGGGLTHKAGTGYETSASSLGGGDSDQEIITADVNNDGNLDLISAGGSNRVYISLGNGQGGFGAPTAQTTTHTSTTGVAAADINKDGKIDLVVTTNNGWVDYMEGNGDGTFSAKSSAQPGTALSNIKIADFNNDGNFDVVVGDNSGLASEAYVLLGNGIGSFSTTAYSGPSGIGLSGLDIGDFNGDGNVDFVTANSSNSSIAVYLGGGTGNFTRSTFSGGLGSGAILAVGDVNRDGYDDIVGARTSGYRSFISNGNGTFTAGTTYVAAASISDINLGDMNNDGILDLVAVGTNATRVMFGVGEGSYLSSLNSTNTSAVNLTLGDFNKDGVLDVGLGVDTATYVQLSTTEDVTTMQLLDLTSRVDALGSLDIVDLVMQRVQKEMNTLGANQNRLASALNTLLSTQLNTEAAYGRIADADMAEESANSLRLRILQQTSTELLGQANQEPNIALSLLKQA